MYYLSSCAHLGPSEARVKRPHEDKIIFSLVYRTLFFYTTCGKVNLGGHASLSELAQNLTLRTKCENSYFRHTYVRKFEFPHARQKGCALKIELSTRCIKKCCTIHVRERDSILCAFPPSLHSGVNMTQNENLFSRTRIVMYYLYSAT